MEIRRKTQQRKYRKVWVENAIPLLPARKEYIYIYIYAYRDDIYIYIYVVTLDVTLNKCYTTQKPVIEFIF